VVTPPPDEEAPTGTGLPPEALVGGGLLALVLGYIGLYWRGAAAMDRYAGGFVIETCPVCKRGRLSVETRLNRFLGIPRPRSTVRCDSCRSVLREAGSRRWRYAVDRAFNPGLYQRWNGSLIDEETLKTLIDQLTAPPTARPPITPPKFIDDDSPLEP
jgi:hypothetical protein